MCSGRTQEKMADWQRRSRTSLKRRRTQRTERIRWTGVLRRIAWPIGEEQELRLWGETLRYTPLMVMALDLAMGVVWAASTAPGFPGPRGQREEAWGGWVEVGEFLWSHFCGDLSRTPPAAVCSSYNWLPGVVMAGAAALACVAHIALW